MIEQEVIHVARDEFYLDEAFVDVCYWDAKVVLWDTGLALVHYDDFDVELITEDGKSLGVFFDLDELNDWLMEQGCYDD